MSSYDLVVVGGGLAAVRTVQHVRDLGFAGTVALVSDEAEVPYDRPPLSKEFLLGQLADEAIALVPADRLAALDVTLLLGRRAVGLDTAARVVTVGGGDPVTYGQLVVATGCEARRLDAVADSADTHYLRTADDARALGPKLTDGARVVIVGAGFIGLEVASAARARGASVTVVEAAPQPLTRSLGPDLAAWLQGWHEGQGVAFHVGVSVAEDRPGDADKRLVLSDGTVLAADVVVIGVGIQRDLAWLSDAGVETHVGVVCDKAGRTNVDGVLAAGDVACLHVDGVCDPIQHWTAAGESAQRAAATVAGEDASTGEDEAYFWSNQAGLRLQAVGHYAPGAVTTVVAGDLGSGAFVARYELDGVLVGVVGSNNPREFLKNRKDYRAVIAGA